jgi:exonuclease III
LKEIPSVPVGRKEAIPDGHLERSHPGAWVAADIQILSVGLVTVVSVYGVMHKLRNEVTYATTSVQRTLSDLTPVLDVHRSKARVVMAGDFNVSPQIGSSDTNAHVAIIDRIKAFGLVDCLGSKHDGYVRTHRHRNKMDGKAWQIDWMFSSMKLKLSSCKPMDVEEAWKLSDHCPVVADFDV